MSSPEQLLINLLSDAGISGFELVPHNGTFLIKMESPCEEIGALTVRVDENDVMLSCKMSHTHVTKQDGTDFVERAAIAICDLIADRIALSREIAPNGHQISSGWCPVHAIGSVSPGYDKLVRKLYGGPSRREYWFWSGKRVEL